MGRDSLKDDKIKKVLDVDGGAGNADITVATGQLDYRHLFDMLNELPLEKMNMLDICKAIYERLVVKFMGEYQEERGMRIKYENKIIELRGEIIDLEQKLVKAGALVPEDRKEEIV